MLSGALVDYVSLIPKTTCPKTKQTLETPCCLDVQADKQRLCSQKHLLESMSDRLKQPHVKISLRKKRIMHLLATGTKTKAHVVVQPALPNLAPTAQGLGMGNKMHSVGPDRSKMPPAVRLHEGTHLGLETYSNPLLQIFASFALSVCVLQCCYSVHI